MNNVNSLDWFITNKCLSKLCPFCYAPFSAFSEDSSLSQAMKICNEIKNKRIEFVTLCGGEPLLYPYLNDVVDYLNRSNVKIILTTGLCVQDPIEKIKAIEDKIYMLSLPVDAYTSEKLSLLRGKNVFDTVKLILERYTDLSSRPKVKIGTVLNALNANDIDKIFSFLQNYRNVVNAWRVYMFSPYGIGKENIEKLLITEAEFFDYTSKIIKANSLLLKPLNISTRTREQNKGYCIIMDSQGNMYKYLEEYYPLSSSIFDSIENITSNYDMTNNHEQKKWQYD